MMQPPSNPAATLLAVEGLHKSFGAVAAVAGVSFAVAAGEMVALIGPNGAGKSTCFNIISGQLKPDSGGVLFEGQSLGGLSSRAIWRLGISRTFQVAATFATLSVLENVQMALLSRGRQHYALSARIMRRHQDEAIELLTQVGMQQQAGRVCGILAYGDIKRVELAVALANAPKLLLMDEPTAGMAPGERQDLMALTRRLVKERGMGVLFTEHSMDVVFGYADQIVVLARGVVIAAGDGDAILSDEKVQRAYLGRSKSSSKKTAVPRR
jgi:branched-chain amino acid transport system ATP-binding protein